MPSVLFVCTANQCRSPMAEALFRQYIADHGQLDEWKIASAGTWATEGARAVGHVQSVMQTRSLDVSEHRASDVGDVPLQEYNLILTMERGHKEALQLEFFTVASRVYLLSEMIGQTFDIIDPIGKPHDEYEFTATELAQLIEQGADRIIELASHPSS